MITIRPPRPQAWGSVVEVERRNRIRLSVYAYAYEFEDVSLITDAEFDMLALSIRPLVSTGNETLDKFFRTIFSPHTGQWVHQHPDIPGLRRLYQKHYLQRVHCAKIERTIVIAPPAARPASAPAIRIVYPSVSLSISSGS